MAVRLGTAIDASALIVAHRESRSLSSAMCSSDDSDWPAHRLTLYIRDLCGIPLEATTLCRYLYCGLRQRIASADMTEHDKLQRLTVKKE